MALGPAFAGSEYRSRISGRGINAHHRRAVAHQVFARAGAERCHDACGALRAFGCTLDGAVYFYAGYGSAIAHAHGHSRIIGVAVDFGVDHGKVAEDGAGLERAEQRHGSRIAVEGIALPVKLARKFFDLRHLRIPDVQIVGQAVFCVGRLLDLRKVVGAVNKEVPLLVHDQRGAVAFGDFKPAVIDNRDVILGIPYPGLILSEFKAETDIQLLFHQLAFGHRDALAALVCAVVAGLAVDGDFFAGVIVYQLAFLIVRDPVRIHRIFGCDRAAESDVVGYDSAILVLPAAQQGGAVLFSVIGRLLYDGHVLDKAAFHMALGSAANAAGVFAVPDHDSIRGHAVAHSGREGMAHLPDKAAYAALAADGALRGTAGDFTDEIRLNIADQDAYKGVRPYYIRYRVAVGHVYNAAGKVSYQPADVAGPLYGPRHINIADLALA